MFQEQAGDVGGDPQVGGVHKRQEPGKTQENIETHGQQTIDEHFIQQSDVETVGDHKRKDGKQRHDHQTHNQIQDPAGGGGECLGGGHGFHLFKFPFSEEPARHNHQDQGHQHIDYHHGKISDEEFSQGLNHPNQQRGKYGPPQGAQSPNDDHHK